MSSLLLGADGSPFPILDCEKHKTVNHYLIQYRSVATGIPIFMVNTKNKHGRGTADIMDNLKDWKGVALMYSLFGACKVLDKNPERWFCYVLKHIDSTPEDKYYTHLPEFWEDEEQ